MRFTEAVYIEAVNAEGVKLKVHISRYPDCYHIQIHGDPDPEGLLSKARNPTSRRFVRDFAKRYHLIESRSFRIEQPAHETYFIDGPEQTPAQAQALSDVIRSGHFALQEWTTTPLGLAPDEKE